MPLVISSLQNKYLHMRDSRPDFRRDSAQEKASELLQNALNSLAKKTTLFRSAPMPHIYLWGPVGRGKTMLMDMFCSCIHEDKVLRLHFHHFMAMIHQQLQTFSGHKDPLSKVSEHLSTQYQILCFDEFQVSDIGDAMLLGRLYAALFKHNILIISTSNLPPDELYKDGLQRDRFLPAIKMIKENMSIHSLDGGKDHRHRKLNIRTAYFINDESRIHQTYEEVTGNTPNNQTKQIRLCNREITCKATHEGSIYFDFSTLCEGPRSALDYIDLAKNYHSIFISHVPQFTGSNREQIKARGTEDSASGINPTGARQVLQSASDDPARRFISLVDELYDRRVNLYLSAAVPMEDLYQAELLKEPFQRTLSRLYEMSTTEYQDTPPVNSPH